MRSLFAFLALLMAAAPVAAFDGPLSQYLWQKRPVVVFADTALDPNFIEQLSLLERAREALDLRDVVVLTDTDPSIASELRKLYRPRGFQLLLIGKDGEVKLRKPFPWSVRELSRAIDKMPMRRQEILRQKEAAGAAVTTN